MGLDQPDNLHAVTVFGETSQPRSAVVIVRAQWNAQTLQQKAEQAANHQVVEHGNHKIHTFTAHKDTESAHEAAATLFKPDMLVLALSDKRLAAALDVLDGKSDTLSEKDSAATLTAKVQPATIVLVRCLDLKDSAVAKLLPALELIKSFTYVEGEHEGTWRSNLTITADSHDAAQQMAKVLEGAGAWLSLHGHNRPWFLELLHKTQLHVEDNVVHVTFEVPVETVAQHMPEICKAIQEHAHVHLGKLFHHADE
jgi:hypothetical protein